MRRRASPAPGCDRAAGPACLQHRWCAPSHCAISLNKGVGTCQIQITAPARTLDRQESAAENARPEPDPEAPGKPETPVQLTKPSWKYIARKTFREFSDDQCLDLAAALTYYAVLSMFPALLALVSLLGLFGQQGKTDELITVLSDMGAGTVADTIRGRSTN